MKKDIQEEKLGQHSLKCKEVAKLKDEFFPLHSRMQEYGEKAKRIKNSLEVRATKARNFLQKKSSARSSIIGEGGLLVHSKSVPLKQEIAALLKKATQDSESDQCSSDEEPEMNMEIYGKFAGEVKKSAGALSTVANIAEKVNNWTFESGSAVDFHLKNELLNLCEELTDIKVSEFMSKFVTDLSIYMEFQVKYLKKHTELLADETESLKRNPIGNKFLSKRSASTKALKKKQAELHPLLPVFKEDESSTNNSVSDSPKSGSFTSLSEDFNTPSQDSKKLHRKLPSNKQIKLQRPSIFQKAVALAKKDQENEVEQTDQQQENNGAFIFRRNSKKNSKLIKADSMRSVIAPSKEKSQPFINLALIEANQENIPQKPTMNQSKKLKGLKNLQNSLLKSLHIQELYQGKAFPSLLEKGEFMDDDITPVANTQNAKAVVWDSPVVKGYYSDTSTSRSAARMVSLVDSPKIDLNEFEFIKFLGKGAYGTVWLVKKKATNDIYAMKIVEWADRFTTNRIHTLKSERDIYEILQGDFVVKALWTFHYQNFICFVTEVMTGGDFNNILEEVGRLDEEQARFYLAELILAIESIHELGIVHRDLKPDNILIDGKGHIRLTDFGLSERGLSKLRRESFSGGSEMTTSDLPDEVVDIQEKVNEKKSTLTKSKRGSAVENVQIQIGNKGNKEKEKKKHEDIFRFLEKKPKFLGTRKKKRGLTIKQEKISSPNGKKPSMVGTPDYMAPEVINARDYNGETYNQKCMDWWSLGVILYQFLVGVTPFADLTLESVFDNIRNRRFEWPPIGDDEDSISANAADLIDKLLNPDPNKRLGAKGAKEVKAHPFFQGFDWKNCRKNNGPIIPCSKNIEDYEQRIEGTFSEAEENKRIIFDNLGLNLKSQPNRVIEMGGFQLRRLDVLDKLNQDTYISMQKKKSDPIQKMILIKRF